MERGRGAPAFNWTESSPCFPKGIPFHLELLHEKSNLVVGLDKPLVGPPIHRRQTKVVHQRVLHFWTGKANFAEVVEHEPSVSRVYDVSSGDEDINIV